MMIGTALMTVMPSYAAVGLTAPVLVIAARLLRGFSVGGEFASSTAFLVEHRPDRAGFFASWQWSSQGLAALIATGFGALLTTTLPAADLQSWGWRIPFAFGLLIGPVGYYIRSRMAETPEFLEAGEAPAPLGNLFVEQWDRLLLTTGAVVASTSSQYMIVYIVTYAMRELGLPQSISFIAGMVAAALQAVVVVCRHLGRPDRAAPHHDRRGDPVHTHGLSGFHAARCARHAGRADRRRVLDQLAQIFLFRRAAVADSEDFSRDDTRVRYVARLQYRGADFRWLRTVLRSVADRSHGLEARA
jgi:MFS family permease